MKTPALMSSLKEFVNPLVGRYLNLPAHDRKSLKILGVFLLFVLFYLYCWRPSMSYKQEAERIYTNNAALYQWMRENEPRARNMYTGSETDITSASLLSIVGSTTQVHGIALNRYEPTRDNGMRIWLENVSFNTLITWLDSLAQEHAISITQLTMEKRDSGFVDARIELSR